MGHGGAIAPPSPPRGTEPGKAGLDVIDADVAHSEGTAAVRGDRADAGFDGVALQSVDAGAAQARALKPRRISLVSRKP